MGTHEEKPSLPVRALFGMIDNISPPNLADCPAVNLKSDNN